MKKTILITGGSGFIGTDLISLLETQANINIINIDKSRPINEKQLGYWTKLNILDLDGLKQSLNLSQPDIIIHLAARTDTLSDSLMDYIENTEGTANLIKAAEGLECLQHIVITSTQYVYKNSQKPFQDVDDDYMPHTVYGKSKVITEELTRSSNLKCIWTIVRPTNVWGPWHMRYPKELWRMIDKGFYMHPGSEIVIRTYGYVKNISHQIDSIINASADRVAGKTFYLGDMPIDSYLWLEALSHRIGVKQVKRIPRFIFKSASLVGDALKLANVPFPLYSERYHNMVEDYIAPTNVTINEFGLSHPNLQDNVNETITWVEGEGQQFFEYWKNR